MRKLADVISVKENGTATIMLYKHKKCHGCGSCNKHMHPGSIFEAKNNANAKTGEMVDVNVKKAFSLTEFLIMYVLPTLSFFIGLLAGPLIFKGEKVGALSVGLAFVLLALSIMISVVYKKNYHPDYSVSIVKRIVPSEPRLK